MFDERWDFYDETCFECGVFHNTTGRVAFDGGFGVGYFEPDVFWDVDIDDVAVEELEVDSVVAFFKEAGDFVCDTFIDLELLEGFWIHEVEVVVVAVEVLNSLVCDFGGLDFFLAFESFRDDGAGDEVFEFDVYDTTAAADDFLGIFEDTVWCAVDLDEGVFLKFCWSVHVPPSCSRRMVGMRGVARA